MNVIYKNIRQEWTRLSTACIGLLCMAQSVIAADVKHQDERSAEPTDLLDSMHHIKAVVVTAKTAGREVVPAQHIDARQLEKLGTQSVADALRYFGGLQIKDYGGVGGVKTVNIRSMGTNHLGVFYDGVELGNAQNGQIDLGQLSLDNVEEISLYNAQKSAIFQSAADFTKAGSVYIRTRTPRLDSVRTRHFKARMKYGASDLLQGSLLYEQRLSASLAASISAGALTSSGKYRFRYRRKNSDGTVAYDTTAVRQNGDIWAWRAEANLFGKLTEGSWTAKLYSYNSERGIPGAIVNNVWRRGERQWDHNHFVQASAHQRLLPRLMTKLMAKYAYYDTRYVNRDTTKMMIDNSYMQQELYFSWANLYELSEQWTASFCYDYRWNFLDADIQGFSSPTRHAHSFALATALTLDRLSMQGSLAASIVDDREGHPRELAPAIIAQYTPFDSRLLTLRCFAKKSFRMPTFNDLYYTEVGNARLKPETALQYDAGLTLAKSIQRGWLREFSLQTDVYYNSVHNKIVAYPKGEQFRWTMLNLGKVHITGVDMQAMAAFQPMRTLRVETRLQYTWQKAIDVTDPQQSFYRDQIPYIPTHSGSAVVNVSCGAWELNYSFIYAGERYSQQENIPVNHLQPWYTSDLAVAYQLTLKPVLLRMALQVNNLFSQDYDVILNYPMPKRNAALTLTVEW